MLTFMTATRTPGAPVVENGLLISTNPATGRGWKGIYSPDVVSVGEAPTTFAPRSRTAR